MPPKPPDDEGGRRYAGRSPGQRRAERRRRLLDAALELYGTAGYRATPVAQVCKAARVAPVKFYEEFAGSEELIIALSSDIWDPLRKDLLDAMAAAAPSIEEMSRAGVRAYCHGLLDDPRRARVLCIEFPTASPIAERVRREQIVQFSSLSFAAFQALTGARQEQPLGRRQLAMLANALVGAIDEAIRYWLFEPEPRQPIDDVVETLITVYVAVGTYLVFGAPVT